MRIPRLFLSVALATALSGCQTLTWVGSGYASKPLTFGGGDGNGGVDLARIKAAFEKDCDPAIDDCKRKRNGYVAGWMAESVQLCTEHLRGIYGNEAAANIASGSIATFASAAASVSSSLRAAGNLAALSTFANAERALFNETVYKSMLTTAIGSKIREKREIKGKALLDDFSQCYADYPIELAFYKVLDYHEACAFHRGLEWALAEGTSNNNETRRAQLENQLIVQGNQINAYLQAYDGKKPTQFWAENSSKPEEIKDPVLRAHVIRFQALQTEITALGGKTVAGKATAMNATQDKAKDDKANQASQSGK